jgi:ATP-binding cassette, subfamily B, bacterial
MFRISKSIDTVLLRAGRLSLLSRAFMTGTICALSVPILIWIFGNVVHVLIEVRSDSDVSFAKWIPDLESCLPVAMTPLAKITLLLIIGLAFFVLISVSMYLFNRQIQSAAVEFETRIISALRVHSKQLAVSRTLSAQEAALIDSLEYHLPRIRTNLARWWRTYPRHAIQCVGCLIIVVLIQPLLAAISLVGAALVYLIYRYVERIRKNALPLVRERATKNRSELVRLCLKGPLLASVHSEPAVDQTFDDHLVHYQKDAEQSLSNSAWKMPLFVATIGVLCCLFAFVVAVQILRPDSTFSIAGAVTFLTASGCAALSGFRLQASARDLRQVESAAEELSHFLSLAVDQQNGGVLKHVDLVCKQAELDHVTLRDCNGRKLLEDVSAVFEPGELIGIVATDRIQAQALAELIMGYGRPTSGRMLIDGVLTSDLVVDNLSKCALWVGGDGPLFTGSVQDNLVATGNDNGQVDFNAALLSARALDTVQRLPNGVATLISPGDDRLPVDAAFRLGIARAKLRSPSIIVINEPNESVDATTEQETLEAIQSLVSSKAITVIVPSRLSTVRACNKILLLHEHIVTDTGSHAELLQRCELYRHLNYVRFNAFRNLA